MEDNTLTGMPLGEGDEAIGEWLRRELVERFGHETESWATDRMARILARLNAARAACPVGGACPRPLRAEILWVGMMTAFATPGRLVFVTRELLQRFTDDDPVAFVVAHEAAHHDLGHLRLLASALERARRIPGGMTATLLFGVIQRALTSPEREAAADAYGLDLCVAAGYDPRRSLEVFDALERHLIDHGDLDGIFGPDDVTRGAAEGWQAVWGEVSRAAWRLKRGYPSLRERRAALQRQMWDVYGVRG